MAGGEAYSFLLKKKRTSAVQYVIDNLTEAMVRRDLKPGDRIPTEMELSEQLGVARNTVREAIKMLAFLGVLEIRRPEGTFVCDGFSDAVINPMIYGIILGQGDSYNSLMELRETIEAGVVRLAMDKATDDEISSLQGPLMELRQCCMQQPPNVDAAFDADNRFHDTIMEIGHNSMVAKINAIVRTLTHEARYETVRRMVESGHGQELYAAHEQIYEMLCKRERKDLNRFIRETYFL